MSNRTYTMNKGINKPLTFRGLKAQYIAWLGAVLVGDLLLFAIMRVIGVNSWVCIMSSCGIGAILLTGIARASKKHGVHGLMKKMAAKKIPKKMRSFSRKRFISFRQPLNRA